MPTEHYKPTEKELITKLCEAFAMLDNPEEVYYFLVDVCTRKEIAQLSQRFHAATLLNAGLTYSRIIELTDISSTTLSRVSQSLQFGQGYKNVLGKQNKH